MNRPIKFRAWDGKRMIYPEHTYGEDVGSEIFLAFNPFSLKICTIRIDAHVQNSVSEHEDESGILMQFTGILDKNGKEIYEGDVVEMYLLGSSPIPQKIITAVSFYEGTFTVLKVNGEPLTLRDAIILSSKAKQGFQVIGNIFENPELLPNTPSK